MPARTASAKNCSAVRASASSGGAAAECAALLDLDRYIDLCQKMNARKLELPLEVASELRRHVLASVSAPSAATAAAVVGAVAVAVAVAARLRPQPWRRARSARRPAHQSRPKSDPAHPPSPSSPTPRFAACGASGDRDEG